MTHRLTTIALGTAMVLAAVVASAQTAPGATAAPPRAPSGVLRAQGAATDESSLLDTALNWAGDLQLLERMAGTVDGWYPRFGGITRGSGFAAGPGYRTHAFGDQVRFDVSAGFSVRWYKAVDLRARWWQATNERAELWTDYRFEDFPQEDFFGIGPDTTEATRTNYGFRSSDVVIRGHLQPQSWLRVGASLGYMSPTIGPGHDSEWPSTEQLFTDRSAPGLRSQPNFLHTELFTDVDYRDAPGNPTSGGVYHAAFSVWDDRTLNQYDFRRFDGTLTQYVPITPNRRHVVSGRLGISFANNAPGQRVPFYFFPYLGGQDTVRSFREFRFRDENVLWFGPEYRWTPRGWLSAAAFADFGKVAHDWQDMNLTDLEHGYGVGLRLHSPTQTFVTLDVAFGGGEGWRTFLKIGPF